MVEQLERLNAALAGRYVLERELGRGGMATVYLAWDPKHGRRVALKMLRPDIAASLGPERFLREIEIAARLRHPHILPLYDSGAADEFLYYVMPYAEGESLRDRLRHEKQLPLDEVMRIGREVADALSYAHRQGVVHRDIKPENILLEARHAIVTDFGVAWAITVAGSDRLTAAGTAVGTPTYMSPEQASGRDTVDGRSDIYSLGCVLYELLAGEPPYSGASAQAVFARKTTNPVPPLRTVRETVPPSLEHVIGRALAKAPADRFTTAEEFDGALAASTAARRLAPPARRVLLFAASAAIVLGVGSWALAHRGGASLDRTAIAVLPCENLSRDPEQQYVSDQVTEELIARLSAATGLQVKSWLSTQRYRGTAKTPSDIARELGVGSLVRCGALQGREHVRVAVQLIEARHDQVIWSNDYRRPLTAENIFSIESAIAREIADALGAAVSRAAQAQQARPPTGNLEALTSYRLGRHFWNMRTAEGLQKSLEYYRRAIAADTAFALAYVGVAEATGFLGQVAPLPPRQFMPRVKQAVLKALAIDETVAEAHSGLGQVLLLYDWDWPSANREFHRAIELEPNSAGAHLWYGQSLSYVGEHDEAVTESRLAVTLDPTLPFVRDNLAFRLYYAHRYQEALDEGQRALELDPNHWVAYLVLGMVRAARGEYPEAITAYERAYRLSGESVVPLARMGQTYGAAGMRAAAESVLRQLRSRTARGYVPATYVATVYLGLGDHDSVFAWLDKAFEERDFNLIWYLGGEPTFDGLQADLRYQMLRKRVGFEEWAHPVRASAAAENGHTP